MNKDYLTDMPKKYNNAQREAMEGSPKQKWRRLGDAGVPPIPDMPSWIELINGMRWALAGTCAPRQRERKVS